MNQPTPDYNISMEQELKRHLAITSVAFTDHSSSYQHLDFTLELSGKRFSLDVKEKRQHYTPANWPPYIPEQDMFIVDDLAVRKCLAYSPYSGLLVRDNLQHRYVFYSVVDLALMPRLRLNRPIQKQQSALKGKWIINLQNGVQSNTLADALGTIREYIAQATTIFLDTLECYGHYAGEEIGQGGITRRPGHWDTDVSSTR